jgi:large-conductance mechanosensitive channel
MYPFDYAKQSLIDAFLFADFQVMFPKSLKAIVAILFIAFSVFLIYAAKKKAKESKYQKLVANGTNDPSFHQTNISTIASYQQTQTNTSYALPPTQKVVTYCVIDGRLVDNS